MRHLIAVKIKIFASNAIFYQKTFCPILAAPLINTACSIDVVQFVYDINNRWLRIVGGGEGEHCELEAPTVSLVTGCSESEFIAFLGCERLIDRFRLRPVTFVANALQWDDICAIANGDYRVCIDKIR